MLNGITSNSLYVILVEIYKSVVHPKADTGNILALIEYIEEQLIWSLDLSLKAAKGEDIEEFGDIEKEIEILKREKLTKTTIFRTPKTLFELINHVNDDLWVPLDKILTKFEDFFTESKTENHVNDTKVERTKTIIAPMFKITRLFSDREVSVKPYEIFGYDLEEEEVSEVSWTKKMLSLKSAENKIDYEIVCSLKLQEAYYILNISEFNTNTSSILKNKKVLFEIKNEYKTFFMSDSVDGIIRVVSNHLISILKN